ncbi:MAG: HAD family hydrolase, partial [Aminobacterium colombiense]|nr:HAD family hydrolase [Aminobacterium colombiense]
MIKLLVLDVDGTLTDGGVYLDGRGNEFKRFD